MWILGVNAPIAGWHDSAACLIDGDGHIIALAEEERFIQKKHALHVGPRHATEYCLKTAGIQPADIDVVSVGWSMPYTSEHIYGVPWTFDSGVEWVRAMLGWNVNANTVPDLVFVPHHRAHATASFHASSYESAAIVVVDGDGDDESISIFHGQLNRPLVRKRAWPRINSLGFLYDAASLFIGLDALEAGKTMGLAAYGRARGLEPWALISEDEEIQPVIAPRRRDHYPSIIKSWQRCFAKLARHKVRSAPAQLDANDAAVRVAWSAQYAVETAVTRLVALAREMTGEERVCLGGGVALNCAANGLIQDPLYVPPVPYDAGIALGAAWSLAPPAGPLPPLSPYLGPEPFAGGLAQAIPSSGLLQGSLDIGQICEALANGAVGAVVEGRAEVGPRALGHRSIIASPASIALRDRVNAVKQREPWRPLAPIVFDRNIQRLWPARDHLFRYMVGAVNVFDSARALLPGATHVDGTTRPQALPDASETIIGDVLSMWGDRAGGTLINTSFNLRGKPIVTFVDEALTTFNAMPLDFLVMGDKVYSKETGWWKPRVPPGAPAPRPARAGL